MRGLNRDARDQSTTDEAAPDSGDPPVVSRIETDRFCESCGYNLHLQEVRRDPRTGVLLTRCPECGRYAPAQTHTTAGRLWLRRLAGAFILGWVMLLLVLVGAAVGLQLAVLGVSGGELVEHVPIHVPTTNPGTGLFRRTYSFQWAFTSDVREVITVTSAASGVSIGLALLTAVVTVVLLPHWPRWIYPLYMLGIGLLAAVCVQATVYIERPDLFDSRLPITAIITCAYLVSGVAGAVFGRPLARLMLNVLLPPRLREPFAYLWQVDGRIPPTRRPESAAER